MSKIDNRIPCDICGKEITQSNVAKHKKAKHGAERKRVMYRRHARPQTASGKVASTQDKMLFVEFQPESVQQLSPSPISRASTMPPAVGYGDAALSPSPLLIATPPPPPHDQFGLLPNGMDYTGFNGYLPTQSLFLDNFSALGSSLDHSQDLYLRTDPIPVANCHDDQHWFMDNHVESPSWELSGSYGSNHSMSEPHMPTDLLSSFVISRLIPPRPATSPQYVPQVHPASYPSTPYFMPY